MLKAGLFLTVLKQLLREKKYDNKSPNSTRPWQHVLEPISGYLILGERIVLIHLKNFLDLGIFLVQDLRKQKKLLK